MSNPLHELISELRRAANAISKLSGRQRSLEARIASELGEGVFQIGAHQVTIRHDWAIDPEKFSEAYPVHQGKNYRMYDVRPRVDVAAMNIPQEELKKISRQISQVLIK